MARRRPASPPLGRLSSRQRRPERRERGLASRRPRQPVLFRARAGGMQALPGERV